MPAAILGDLLRGDARHWPVRSSPAGSVEVPLSTQWSTLLGDRSCAANPLPIRDFWRRAAEIAAAPVFLFRCSFCAAISCDSRPPRLRLVGVGDPGGADFEVALGLRELLGEPRSSARRRASRCSRPAARRSNACATRSIKSCFACRKVASACDTLGFGLFVSYPVLVAKERLRRRDASSELELYVELPPISPGAGGAKRDPRRSICVFAWTVTAGELRTNPAAAFPGRPCSSRGPRRRPRPRSALRDIPTTNRLPRPAQRHRISPRPRAIRRIGALRIR